MGRYRDHRITVRLTEEDIKARFEDGVLKLTMPKKEAQKLPEKKAIMIE